MRRKNTSEMKEKTILISNRHSTKIQNLKEVNQKTGFQIQRLYSTK